MPRLPLVRSGARRRRAPGSDGRVGRAVAEREAGRDGRTGFSITLEDAQGVAWEPRARDTTTSRSRTFRGAQLPPHGAGRRPAYSGGSSDHGVLDRHADERDVQVQLRPARVDDARFLHGRSDGAATSAHARAPACDGGETSRASRPAFVITLKTVKGKAVKTMKRGTYTMVVRDQSHSQRARRRARLQPEDEPADV